MAKRGRIAPFPKLDHYPITGSRIAVVLPEPGSQPARLYPDDRIETRIKAFTTAKDLRPDKVLLEPFTPAFYRFFDSEAQKPLEVLGG